MNKLKSIFLTLTVSHKLDAAWSQLALGPFTVGCLLPVYQSAQRKDAYRRSWNAFQNRPTEMEGLRTLLNFIGIIWKLQNLGIHLFNSAF